MRSLPARTERLVALAGGLALLTAACGGSGSATIGTATAAPAAAATDADPAAAASGVVVHDFGAIPHGQARTHDFELRIPGGGAGYVPVGFRSGCSCAGHRFVIRDRDGDEREVGHLPRPYRTLQEGDTLILRLTIDTSRKEVVDVPRVTMEGQVLVQPADDDQRLVELDVVFHYAINARIEPVPVAHLHFGALPRSGSYRQTIQLRRDPEFADVELGPVSADDPRIEAKLTQEPGLALLDVAFAPRATDSLGPVRTAVQVATSLPDGYQLVIPVSGELIDDIVVEPYNHVSFGRIDLAQPDERFVNVTDHDQRRSAAFAVAAIADAHGRSLSDHFEVRLEPVVGAPRTTRVYLRYRGSLQGAGFRGTLELCKPGGAEPRTAITFVGFNRNL
jgi:hypothetical protein